MNSIPPYIDGYDRKSHIRCDIFANPVIEVYPWIYIIVSTLKHRRKEVVDALEGQFYHDLRKQVRIYKSV